MYVDMYMDNMYIRSVAKLNILKSGAASEISTERCCCANVGVNLYE